MTRTWRWLTAASVALLLVGLTLRGRIALQLSSGWFAYAPLSESSFRTVWVSPWLSATGWRLTGIGLGGLCVLLAHRARRRRTGRH